jgi:hypothetical protein
MSNYARSVGVVVIVAGTIGGLVVLKTYYNIFDRYHNAGILPGLLSLAIISLGISFVVTRKYLTIWNVFAFLLPILVFAVGLALRTLALIITFGSGPFI